MSVKRPARVPSHVQRHLGLDGKVKRAFNGKIYQMCEYDFHRRTWIGTNLEGVREDFVKPTRQRG